MSEGTSPSTEELAYLLWEKQGRPENRSAQNWIEAEYLARSLAVATRDENEADLRMRGLGPLTEAEWQPRNMEVEQGESSGSAMLEKPQFGVGATSVIASCVAGTAMVIAVGMLFHSLGKSASRIHTKGDQYVIHYRSGSCRVLVWWIVL